MTTRNKLLCAAAASFVLMEVMLWASTRALDQGLMTVFVFNAFLFLTSTFVLIVMAVLAKD